MVPSMEKPLSWNSMLAIVILAGVFGSSAGTGTAGNPSKGLLVSTAAGAAYRAGDALFVLGCGSLASWLEAITRTALSVKKSNWRLWGPIFAV